MKIDPESTASTRRQQMWNVLIWILIGVLFALTAVWMVWASRQPKIRSIYTPDEVILHDRSAS